MLSKELESALNLSFKNARDKRHEYMTIEHLLLALLETQSVLYLLKAYGVDTERLSRELFLYIEQTTSLIPATEGHRETQPTLGFQRVLQRAVFHVQSAGKDEVTGLNVLAAIFSEPDSHALQCLHQYNIQRMDVMNFIAHGTIKAEKGTMPPPREDIEPLSMSDTESASTEFGHKNPVQNYTVDLNELARQGKIDPFVGRKAEIERLIQILCRRRKNNPLLVGEAGVGKTAVIEGLASLIVQKKVPQALEKCTIYALDLGKLLAGTKYRGDFEKRLTILLQYFTKDPGAILFIDEIHIIIGAGASSGGVMDASNLIKPLLANGSLRCAGATTYQEYRGIFEKDRALARRFQKVDVRESSKVETLEILKGLQSALEKHHHVRYTSSALKAAVELSSRYITDRFLPDKAIDVIDEAGAYQALQEKSSKKKVIRSPEIEHVIARMAQIPKKQVSHSDKILLRNLHTDLKKKIFGQDEAIELLVSAVKVARSGLNDTQRPVGCFLFAGPTGVGKTEVTKQLSECLGVTLLRFDMSEYMEPHTVSRLIGAPPGYVGFDNGGLLTEAVAKTPHAILLLDEIEKAHTEVYNLLLQIMDHGTLTDTNGRKADFRHVILVMTTNAGADVLSRNSMGFLDQDHRSDGSVSLERLFTPEFRNRLDAVLPFKALEEHTVGLIVNKYLEELSDKLKEKSVHLQVDPQAKDWLVCHGYDPKMGARPMARLIQEQIKKPLANELLFGELSLGGRVCVRVVDDKLDLIYEAQQGSGLCVSEKHSEPKTNKRYIEKNSPMPLEMSS